MLSMLKGNRRVVSLGVGTVVSADLIYLSGIPYLVLLMFPHPAVHLMQNPNSSPPSLASSRGSSSVSSLDRVIAIAPAPLLPGENKADYITIAKRIVSASRPRDAIEELLIRDVIDLSWEILGVRRVKSSILKASMTYGVQEVLNDLGQGDGQDYGYTERLGQSWAAGDKSARREVARVLKRAELGTDEVTAKTLESRLDSFERLDRMMASAEARRNNALREIDRHREALGTVTRQTIEEIEDADFQDVETGEITAGARA